MTKTHARETSMLPLLSATAESRPCKREVFDLDVRIGGSHARYKPAPRTYRPDTSPFRPGPSWAHPFHGIHGNHDIPSRGAPA